ncbi:MAG: PepSY domain-containing protein [Parvularculaceae bacterium]
MKNSKAIITKVHLWAGLLLGVQVLLWMSSGVIMSWFHIDDVRGTTRAADIAPLAIVLSDGAAPIGQLIASRSDIAELHLSQRPTGAYFTLTLVDGNTELLDAQSLQGLIPLPEAAIKAAAKADYTGTAALKSLTLLETTPKEYRKETPVWQAQFADRRQTRLYIDPVTGEIKSRRNAIWRLYDFFWMLHIMDYQERENFNNPLLKAASATGFTFAISGLCLVWFRFRSGRYRLPKRRK